MNGRRGSQLLKPEILKQATKFNASADEIYRIVRFLFLFGMGFMLYDHAGSLEIQIEMVMSAFFILGAGASISFATPAKNISFATC